MKKPIVWVLIFLILLVSIVAFVYFKYEKPNQDKISGEMVNISISSEFEGKKISTGFLIKTVDGQIEGRTSNSYEMIQIRANQTIYVTNKNIEDQFYYIQTMKYEISSANMRIDIDIQEPSEIIVSVMETNPNNLTLNLYSENLINPKFCLIWSMNYFLVRATNFTEIRKLDRYRNWDRCYDGDFSLDHSNQSIQITFQTFSTPTSSDFINISIIDPQLDSETDKIVEIV